MFLRILRDIEEFCLKLNSRLQNLKIHYPLLISFIDSTMFLTRCNAFFIMLVYL